MSLQEDIIHGVRRLVIKIGSGVLTTEKGLNLPFFRNLAREIARLKKGGIHIILVSSGAIACGMTLTKLKRRPHIISQKQAVAAMGQPLLMNHYSKAFQREKMVVAQILLTRDDLQNRHRFITAKHAMMELWNHQVVPIVNENDSVAVEEIQVGDNDQLSALVAHLVEADLLLMLTDTDGLYDQDPRVSRLARRIPLVERIDEKTFASATDTRSPKSTGGMITKLKAAKQAALYGIHTWVVKGVNPSVIHSVFKGEDVGTIFLPSKKALSSRQYWIAYSMKALGSMIVDEGAVEALCKAKKSLLASGILAVQGSFDIGDPVSVADKKEQVIAQGLVRYSAKEIERIKGVKSSDIEKILGYKYDDEIIHRDDLVILTTP